MSVLFVTSLINFVVICQVLGQHEIEFIKKPRPFPFFPGDESEFPTPDDPDSDGVIGAAGKHYPTLRSPPPTSFVCDGRLPGMYADMETGCQVYHTCQADMRKESNLCVNGTIFNQATFSCDWWYNVDCPSSAAFYSLNADLGRQPSNEHHRKGTIEFPQLDGDEKKGHHGIVSLSIPPPPPHPSLSISNLPKNIPNSVPNFKQPNFNLEDIPEPPRPRLKKIRPPPPEISQPSSFVEPVSLSILHPPKPGNHDIPPPPLLSKPSEPEILPPPLPPRHRPVPNFEFPSLPRPSHLIGNAPSLPLREMESGKKPDGGSFKFTPGDSQYDRGAFNPAIHLPRRKVISDKKFSRVPDIPHIKPVKSPQMHPVKSGDVISGYSDLYLGKPVDED